MSPSRSTMHALTLLQPGVVAALRQRIVLAHGGLADRVEAEGRRLVSAVDDRGCPWWISAAAVWTDADTSDTPDRPRAAGLATAASRHAAALHGLSDRLGFEAIAAFEHGRELPAVAVPASLQLPGVRLLDGRLDVDYPTVVAIAPGIVRWGAGETWSIAIERALFGAAALPGTELELLTASDRLGEAGLALLTVDLGTPRLAAAGIHRLSVQLATA